TPPLILFNSTKRLSKIPIAKFFISIESNLFNLKALSSIDMKDHRYPVANLIRFGFLCVHRYIPVAFLPIISLDGINGLGQRCIRYGIALHQCYLLPEIFPFRPFNSANFILFETRLFLDYNF